MKNPSQELLDQYIRDALQEQEQGTRLTLELNFSTACATVALLQLALRHPSLSASVKQTGTMICDRMIEELSSTPAIRKVLEMGYHPECDVPRPGPKRG